MRHHVLPASAEKAMLATTAWSLYPLRGPSMQAPTPLPLRRAIVRRHQRGRSAAAIAHALGLPVRTVRQLLRRGRLLGPAALAPTYRGGCRRGRAAQRLCEEALALRRDHPT